MTPSASRSFISTRRSRRSSRSWVSVSNSEAVFANSSSASGSLRCFTSFRSTWMLTSVPPRLAEAFGQHVGHLEDVAGLLADQLVVQLRTELAGAHEVEVVGATGLRDVLAVHGAAHVGRHEVLGADGPLCRLQLSEPLAESLDPFVDLLVGHLGRGLLDLHALIVASASSSRGRTSTVAVKISGLSSSTCSSWMSGSLMGARSSSAYGVAEVRRDRARQELLADDVATDLRVDDLLRHLPLAEPGDLDLVGDAPVRAIQVLRELVDRDLDRELDGVFVGVLHGGLHVSPA